MPRRRWARWAAGVTAVVLALLVSGIIWVARQVNPPGGPGPAVVVRLPSSGSAGAVASVLARQGIIDSPTVFRAYLDLRGATRVEAGAYLLRRNSSYSAVVAALSQGPPMARLTIPEGFRLTQIAARVGELPGHSAAHFLAVANSGEVRSPFEAASSTNLEGLVFPDTYMVGLADTDAQILQRMVDQFDQVADSVGLAQAPSRVGITPYQAVIVASIVEREAKLAADRGKVAEVVYNRLHQSMNLQLDATVIYGLGGSLTSLTQHDLQVPTPYNTYLNAGLPPTPISNPGEAALTAALSPTPGPWLYYVVVSPDGAEAFSSTYAEQQANEARARAAGLG